MKSDRDAKLSQRKVKGKEVDVYVYEWVGKTEAAIYLSNTSTSTYTEKLIIKKMDNLKIEGVSEEKMFVDVKLKVGG